MKREQLEHVLRAASRIVDERDFLVVGSAAVLGTFGDGQLPYEATRSDEADIAPYNDADGEKSLRVEGHWARDRSSTRPSVTTHMGSLSGPRSCRRGGRSGSGPSRPRDVAKGAVGASSAMISPPPNSLQGARRTTSSSAPSSTRASWTWQS